MQLVGLGVWGRYHMHAITVLYARQTSQFMHINIACKIKYDFFLNVLLICIFMKPGSPVSFFFFYILLIKTKSKLTIFILSLIKVNRLAF